MRVGEGNIWTVICEGHGGHNKWQSQFLIFFLYSHTTKCSLVIIHNLISLQIALSSVSCLCWSVFAVSVPDKNKFFCWTVFQLNMDLILGSRFSSSYKPICITLHAIRAYSMLERKLFYISLSKMGLHVVCSDMWCLNKHVKSLNRLPESWLHGSVSSSLQVPVSGNLEVCWEHFTIQLILVYHIYLTIKVIFLLFHSKMLWQPWTPCTCSILVYFQSSDQCTFVTITTFVCNLNSCYFEAVRL